MSGEVIVKKRKDFTLRQLLEILNRHAAFSLAESWDNVGLMVGDPDCRVDGILVALDPTLDTLEQAAEKQLNVVVTHHPLIFHPCKNIDMSLPLGNFLSKAISGRIAVVGCHTNLDVIPGGVSDILAERLGLEDARPLVVTSGCNALMGQEETAESSCGFGRIGSYSPALRREEFLARLETVVDFDTTRIAGRLPEAIGRVAVCGGSGSELAEAAFQQGAQVYLSGEIKHSVARWAEASGFCLIDGGHFATENPIVPVLAEILGRELAGQGEAIPVFTAQQTDPFRLLRDN